MERSLRITAGETTAAVACDHEGVILDFKEIFIESNSKLLISIINSQGEVCALEAQNSIADLKQMVSGLVVLSFRDSATILHIGLQKRPQQHYRFSFNFMLLLCVQNCKDLEYIL
ncbi:hypothetical protein HHK36_007336 [Tetracentron sinense]|uniref:Uncharacterized protein n=1 Tax=Tetracentron sinense TaxID=13715 RepID=A0A834ZIR8_TETSI|nr:hypothetical protein HHK36_007336 [Tetracentron sinense]